MAYLDTDDEPSTTYTVSMNKRRQRTLKQAVAYLQDTYGVAADPNGPGPDFEDVTEENLPLFLKQEFTQS